MNPSEPLSAQAMLDPRSLAPNMAQNFTAAAQDTLRFLRDRMGFALWMVTRVDGEDWIVLSAEDHGYSVTAGTVFRWEDSFCSRMVQGLGPRIAPDANMIPPYASAPIGRQVPIGAYIGVPITHEDGSLFGTLCAIDPTVMSDEIRQDEALVELLASLLSTILSAELKATEAGRAAELAEAEAMRDPLTSLFGRRGWDRLLLAEEDRCVRYGHPACLFSLDLDDLKEVNDLHGHAAGDALLVRAAQALLASTRPSDIVARVGGDEFAVLAPECDAPAARALGERLRQGLDSAGVKAAIGSASRHPSRGLQAAWDEADAEMYRNKRRAKAANAPPVESTLHS